jgi:hypothetical protein
MRWFPLPIAAAFAATMLTAGEGRSEDKPAPKAGWFGVFPQLTMYHCQFEAP